MVFAVKQKREISAVELEKQVLDKEQIRIVVRDDGSKLFPAYAYDRKAAGGSTVADLKINRLDKIMGDVPYEIISGDGTSPHGLTKVDTLRKSYQK